MQTGRKNSWICCYFFLVWSTLISNFFPHAARFLSPNENTSSCIQRWWLIDPVITSTLRWRRAKSEHVGSHRLIATQACFSILSSQILFWRLPNVALWPLSVFLYPPPSNSLFLLASIEEEKKNKKQRGCSSLVFFLLLAGCDERWLCVSRQSCNGDIWRGRAGQVNALCNVCVNSDLFILFYSFCERLWAPCHWLQMFFPY